MQGMDGIFATMNFLALVIYSLCSFSNMKPIDYTPQNNCGSYTK